MELIDKLSEYESIFNSETFNDKLKVTQENIIIVKQMCEAWLNSHEMDENQLTLMEQKTKEI